MAAIGSIILISSPYETVKLVLEQAELYDEAINLKPLEVSCELFDLTEDKLVLVKGALRFWGITWVILSY